MRSAHEAEVTKEAEASASIILALQTQLQQANDDAQQLRHSQAAECAAALERGKTELRANLRDAEAQVVAAEGRLRQAVFDGERQTERVAALVADQTRMEAELRAAEKRRLEVEWELANSKHAKESRCVIPPYPSFHLTRNPSAHITTLFPHTASST